MTRAKLTKFRKTAGHIIKAQRLAVGMTLDALAEQLDVTYQMAQHWEAGRKSMELARFAEICDVLGMDAGKALNLILTNLRGGK